MHVSNFYQDISDADDGFGEPARSHRRAWAGNRAATSAWNDTEGEMDWMPDGQSSSGREPRRVVRSSGRVGADRSPYRYSR
jgi:hypothetical protein